MPPPNQTDRSTLADQDTCGSSAPPSDRAAEGQGGDDELANPFEVDPLCPANLTSDASPDAVPTDSDPVGCVDLGCDNFASDWRDPRTHSGQCLLGRNASAHLTSPVANSSTPLSPPLKPSPVHALTEEVQASPAPGEDTYNVVSFPSPRGSRKTGRPRKRKVSVVGTSTRVGRIKGRPKRIANRPGQPRRWRDLTEREKFRLSIEHCKASRGIAVTLNLSLGRAASLVSETNVTSPVRLFQNSLNRALKDAGLAEIPYGLKFELSPAGRLHLHGVFEHGDMSQEQLARLKRAFRNAAGFIKGKAGASQVKFQEITDAAGWDRYLSKAIRKTSKHMGVERLLLISRSLKRKTRYFYEESRRGRWTG